MVGVLIILDLEREKELYNINAKRLKKIDSTTYMWHHQKESQFLSLWGMEIITCNRCI